LLGKHVWLRPPIPTTTSFLDEQQIVPVEIAHQHGPGKTELFFGTTTTSEETNLTWFCFSFCVTPARSFVAIVVCQCPRSFGFSSFRIGRPSREP
jgi:hypothetical protein